ncbi:hypothetical protein PIB30_089482 [Stylosanthes scabra]|uniref:Uncharacterized protein n=1 Tax=Stylosanthes scabra TaxID=79078 RepID=A0ABU6XV54_9FABA|nr:hypothetical protein [Stylosanthes scabra]
MNQNRGASVCSCEQAGGGGKREISDPVRREIGELAGDGDERGDRRARYGLGRSASVDDGECGVDDVGVDPAPRIVEEERFDLEETVPAQLCEGAVVTVLTALTLSLLSLSQNFESSRKRVSISKTRRRRSSVRERR